MLMGSCLIFLLTLYGIKFIQYLFYFFKGQANGREGLSLGLGFW